MEPHIHRKLAAIEVVETKGIQCLKTSEKGRIEKRFSMSVPVYVDRTPVT